MAIEMDFVDTNNTSVMKKERVHMDAMHSHVMDYKTLTLWTYNPIVCEVMEMSTMDVE